MMITHITGSFNLASSASSEFSPYFIDPVVFGAILYVDNQRIMEKETVAMMYIGMIVVRAILYLNFMRNLIN